MGWTYNNLKRNRLTLDQAKQNHVREATLYSGGTVARIIMHEWHPKTWYAIIGLYAAQTDGKQQKPYQIFLRTDMIDASPAEFGYKDMTEEWDPMSRIDHPPLCARRLSNISRRPKVTPKSFANGWASPTYQK
jgi:hypothetical protein